MDVLASYDSLNRGRLRKEIIHRDFVGYEAGGLLPNAIYIYIYTQNSIFGGSVLERFLDRFFNDFLISF